MSYTIHYDSKPKQEDVEILSNGISAYAKSSKNQSPIESFSFFVYDENHMIQGGCNGAMYFGCLHIDQLWVAEKLRGMSFGKQLIGHAEALAKGKGCLFATVNTMDWEARGFYEKLGYQIEYQRPGYLNHSTLYLMRKSL